MGKGSENGSHERIFVKTPCKQQGIQKKLLIEGKDKWEDWFGDAEGKGKVERDNGECLSGGILFFSFSYPTLELENLASLWIVPAPGVCSPCRAESRFLPQEGGMATLSWGVNCGFE